MTTTIAADPTSAVLDEVREQFTQFRQQYDDLKAHLAEALRGLELLTAKGRRKFGPAALKLHACFVHDSDFYRGGCPSCQAALFDGDRFVGEWDHHDNDARNNALENCWPLCKSCHKEKTVCPGKREFYNALYVGYRALFLKSHPAKQLTLW
jgi:hypothetical protein